MEQILVFSLINDLTLNHVSCYDLMMTNENFHLLQSDESIGFHIDGIEHGWFSLRVCAQKKLYEDGGFGLSR